MGHVQTMQTVGNFDPPPPMWTLLLNSSYLVLWSYEHPPPLGLSTWFVHVPRGGVKNIPSIVYVVYTCPHTFVNTDV